jgi:hypothetical protein
LPQRGFDPLHDYVMDFHPFVEGRMAQGVMDSSRQI